MPAKPQRTHGLRDIISEKVVDGHTEAKTQVSDDGTLILQNIDPR